MLALVLIGILALVLGLRDTRPPLSGEHLQFELELRRIRREIVTPL